MILSQQKTIRIHLMQFYFESRFAFSLNASYTGFHACSFFLTLLLTAVCNQNLFVPLDLFLWCLVSGFVFPFYHPLKIFSRGHIMSTLVWHPQVSMSQRLPRGPLSSLFGFTFHAFVIVWFSACYASGSCLACCIIAQRLQSTNKPNLTYWKWK